MKIIVLGCGGSLGVPVLGCRCYVCKSKNNKNKRTRSSILIESHNARTLIDSSPDIKKQLMYNNIYHIDNIIYTHSHFDHITGIDELKPILNNNNPISVYADKITENFIRQRYRHLKELLNLKELKKLFYIDNMKIETFTTQHGKNTSQGIKINNFAYITDVSHIPEKSHILLNNLQLLIIDCCKYSYTINHLNFSKVFSYIKQFNPKKTVLTHMGHEIEYQEIKKILPQQVNPGFDNMNITL